MVILCEVLAECVCEPLHGNVGRKVVDLSLTCRKPPTTVDSNEEHRTRIEFSIRLKLASITQLSSVLLVIDHKSTEICPFDTVSGTYDEYVHRIQCRLAIVSTSNESQKKIWTSTCLNRVCNDVLMSQLLVLNNTREYLLIPVHVLVTQ